MKPGGRFVLDISNITSPSGRMAMMIEEYMGRPDKFDMLPHEFEDLIKDYFEIIDSDIILPSSSLARIVNICISCDQCLSLSL
jgi:hypothetical protein